MEYLIIADFPVSFLGVGLAWSHQVLALTWFVLARTLWWYLLARLAAFVVAQIRRPATDADAGQCIMKERPVSEGEAACDVAFRSATAALEGREVLGKESCSHRTQDG